MPRFTDDTATKSNCLSFGYPSSRNVWTSDPDEPDAFDRIETRRRDGFAGGVNL